MNNLRTWLLSNNRKVVVIVCYNLSEVVYLRRLFVDVSNVRTVHGLGIDLKNDTKIFFKTLDSVKGGSLRGMETDMLLLTSRVNPSDRIMDTLKIQARKGIFGRFQE